MRVLISGADRCAKHTAHKFVVMNDATSRICCAANDESGMCPECRAAVRGHMSGNSDLPPVARREQDADHREYGVSPLRRDREQIPPPPSLFGAIRADRARAGRSAADAVEARLRQQADERAREWR